MKHLRQEQPWGCGIYAVCNALDKPSFMTPERLAIAHIGGTLFELNEWLKEDGSDYRIDIIYYNCEGYPVPDNILEIHATHGAILPVMIELEFKEDGLRHMIAGFIYPDHTIFLVDSLKDEVVNVKMADLNNQWHKVYGIYVFINKHSHKYITFERDSADEYIASLLNIDDLLTP